MGVAEVRVCALRIMSLQSGDDNIPNCSSAG